MLRRRALLVLAGIAGLLLAGAAQIMRHPFPSDRTPEGAYLRIAKSVDEDHPREIFPYLETEAQWASFSIRDARAEACRRVGASYPEPERPPLLAAYCPFDEAKDGADAFALVARNNGWSARLRRDLSGVALVDASGDRATVVTSRGTRYAFRRRENGIWGLTLFTATLLQESERAARDLDVVRGAAADYERATR